MASTLVLVLFAGRFDVATSRCKPMPLAGSVLSFLQQHHRFTVLMRRIIARSVHPEDHVILKRSSRGVHRFKNMAVPYHVPCILDELCLHTDHHVRLSDCILNLRNKMTAARKVAFNNDTLKLKPRRFSQANTAPTQIVDQPFSLVLKCPRCSCGTECADRRLVTALAWAQITCRRCSFSFSLFKWTCPC